MQFLKDFWAYFSGKKTAIAAFILILSAFLTEVIVGKWHVENTWILPTIETLNWIGMVLGGIGLGHKAVK